CSNTMRPCSAYLTYVELLLTRPIAIVNAHLLEQIEWHESDDDWRYDQRDCWMCGGSGKSEFGHGEGVCDTCDGKRVLPVELTAAA
ncbi:MAG TPA: hypothetical protein VFE62_08545, partial [Gemmataceae bacterium]|nr:hypothetical protein [Gemmataceae bacterium]